MDTYEMKRQLNAGIEAVDVAIGKWNDLKKKWVEMEGQQHFKTCALCLVHAKKDKNCNRCPLVKMKGGVACDAHGSPFRQALGAKNAVLMLRALRRAKHYVEEQKVIDAKAAATKKRHAAALKKQKAAERKRKLAAIPKKGDKVKIKLQQGDCYTHPESVKRLMEGFTYKVVGVTEDRNGIFRGHLVIDNPICFAAVKLRKLK